MPTLEQLAAEALALPSESRAFLAEKLLESLDQQEDFPVSETWIAEIRKRCKEIDDGGVRCIPAEQMMDELRRELS